MSLIIARARYPGNTAAGAERVQGVTKVRPARHEHLCVTIVTHMDLE